jgi:hypothetical protein
MNMLDNLYGFAARYMGDLYILTRNVWGAR